MTVHDQSLTESAPGVLNNDTPDMDANAIPLPMTASLVSGPGNGSVTLNGDGSFVYTPNDDFVGTDTFTYNISGSNSATVTINVINNAPSASDDNNYTVTHDQTLNESAPGVLGNDSGDMDGDLVTAILVDDVANGTLTFNADGSFDYTPNDGYVGSDSFTYKLNDSLTDGNTATVTISVTNQKPSASDDNYTTSHDVELTVTTNGVLSNDNDMDGDALTLSLEDNVSNGSLTLNDDGTFTYTPDPLFVGTDSFTYKISDDIEDSDVVTVTITVTNAVPSAADDDFDYPDPGVQYVDIDVLANDWDMDDDHADLVITSVTTPTFGGTASIVGNKIRYFPPSDYSNNADPELNVFSFGTEFSYTVADPIALADPLAQVGQGTVRAAPKKWTAWAEYSRGNDDPGEKIYETGVIRIELSINDATKKVSLRYTATATTDSRLRTGANGAPEIVRPGDADQGVPEYQYFADMLFLQTSAKPEGNPVPGGGDGVKLTFTPGGIGGSLSGEIEVGTWTNADINGVAVIQMQAGGQYAPVRQQIAWKVTVAQKNGQYESKQAALGAVEVPLPAVLGRIPAPLRIINASNGNGDVFKLGYPAKANGLDRMADNPATNTYDERADPLMPPADWNLKVKARTK